MMDESNAIGRLCSLSLNSLEMEPFLDVFVSVKLSASSIWSGKNQVTPGIKKRDYIH